MIKEFNKILDKGYTYQALRAAISKAYNNHCNINLDYFKYPVDIKNENRNLLKSGTRYYHKNLTIRGNVPVVSHDINNGTLVSRETEFFIEPKASYTMLELINYFYEKTKADTTTYYTKRLVGFINKILETHTLDNFMFMLEAYDRQYGNHQVAFTTNRLLDLNPMALQYIKDVERSCSESGEKNYVYRKRLLPV